MAHEGIEAQREALGANRCPDTNFCVFADIFCTFKVASARSNTLFIHSKDEL